ncbi:MAG: hypothetical protein MK212_14285 [Saprospiraceae bacterium]|nr:hypothetical protein [Saprospiraceae bacterium]
MNFKFHILILITSLSLLSCNSTQKWMKGKDLVKTKDQQYDDCSGYSAFWRHNRANECIYKQYSCLGNGKGVFCAFSKCQAKIDTIIYVEFITNSNYKKPPKKLHYVDWKKENYPYIADGKSFWAKGHNDRVTHMPYLFWIEEDAEFIYYLSDFLPTQTQWGMMQYWSFGKQEGTFKDGKREGVWSMTQYKTNQIPPNDMVNYRIEFEPLGYRELVEYKNGLKDGLTQAFRKNKEGEYRLTRSIPYQQGKIEGWLYEFNLDNSKKDSVLYKNDIIQH